MWCILQISATSSFQQHITQMCIKYTISTDDTNEIFDWMDGFMLNLITENFIFSIFTDDGKETESFSDILQAKKKLNLFIEST